MRNLASVVFLLFILLNAKSCSAGMDRQGNPVLGSEMPVNTTLQSQDVEGLKLLQEVLMKLKFFYYKEIDLSVCIPQLLKGGISACTDRYTYYLDPEKSEEEKTEFIRGEFAGIGATLEINKEGHGVKILEVMENSPAEKAGLQAGDVIVAVSSDVAKSSGTWTLIQEMPVDHAVKLIRGPKGTEVGLKIIRGDELKEFVLTRNMVKITFLSSKIVKEGIGFVKIKAFGGEVAPQFYAAIDKLREQKVKVVIIDVRNNGGGLLNSVLEMNALFAKQGGMCATILFVKDRTGPFQDLPVCGRFVGKFRNMKLVVLQNEHSASASEILSGYLQSDAGAVVIGEKSFGKGVVQSLLQLQNGGVLHITVSEYFIGKKMVKVHDIGIKPDIEVKNPKEMKTDADDAQFQRALKEAESLLK
jgi:carboxyl-terminal processing protease